MGVYKDFLNKNEKASEKITAATQRQQRAAAAAAETVERSGSFRNIYSPTVGKMMTEAEAAQSRPVFRMSENKADVKNFLEKTASDISSQKAAAYESGSGFDNFNSEIVKNLNDTKTGYLLNNFMVGAGQQMDGLTKAPAALADIMTGGRKDRQKQNASNFDLMQQAMQEADADGTPLPRITGDLARMAGQQAVQLGIGQTAGAKIGAGLMGAGVFGNEYVQNRNEGMNVLPSAANAGLKGVSEAGLEYLLGIGGRGASKLTKNIAENPTVQKLASSYPGKILEGFAGEFAEESLQEPVGMMIDKATGKAVTMEDVKNLPKNMLYSGLIGGISGGAMSSVTALPSLGENTQNALRERTAAQVAENTDNVLYTKNNEDITTLLADRLQLPVDEKDDIFANNIISYTDGKSNTQDQERPHFRMRKMFDDTLDEEQRRVFSDVAKSGDKYNATTAAQTAEQAKAQEIAAKFGRRTVFYEGSDNGFISGDSVYINKNAQNPVMAVAGHELTHRIMNDERTKSELLDYIKSQAINETGNTKLKGGFADKFNEKKRLYESRLENVTDDMIWEEIAADIGGDLFMNDEFINRITAEKPSLAMRIRNFIVDIINRLRGKGRYQDVSGSTLEYMRDMAKVAQKYERAFVKARENANSKTTETKYQAVEQNSKGKYVQADRQVIKSENSDDWEEEIYNYINDKIRNGQDVVIPTDDGDNLTISEKTAWKMGFRNEFTASSGKKQPISDDLYKTKINAAAHIDELAQVSKRGNKVVPDTKNHDFAKDGFNYRTAYFRDLDGRYYRLTISVGLNEDNKFVYNIGKIKRASFPDIGAQRQRSIDAPSAEQRSNNSIPQNGEKVKYMFAGKNALTADLSALATAEKMEQNGSTPEEIWKATGWGRGLDGKWRFEIDDSGTGYNIGGKGRALTAEEKQRYDELFRNFVMGEITEAERQEYIQLDNKYKKSIGVGKTGDYLNHPELYEAYPDIADIGYARVNMNDSFTNGSYDPLMNGIAVNKNLDKEGAKSTTLHEGQHIIQEKEGFGSGASPEYWQSQIDRGAVKNKKDDAIKAADARYAELFNNAPDELKSMIRKINQHRIKLEFDKAADIEERIYDSEYDGMFAKIDKADFERRLLRSKNKPRTATELYRNTAGEIEARDVQRRRNMTAEERRNTFPESMKPNDSVVFADGGVSYSQDKSFAEQVSDVLSGKSSDNGNHVYVGETTSILRQLGLNDKPMLITAGHLKDINHDKVEGISKYHGLSEDTINKLPYILNYPAIVFDSFSEKNSDAVCILSEITDDDRLPILVIIKPDGQGKYNDVRIDSNFILSMYGKNNSKGFINNIGQNIDNVLFVDKKRTQELLRVNGLQLPKSFSKLKFNTIIHKTRNVVKESNGNVKHSLSENRIEDRISGDKLLNAYDMIEEIKNAGGEVDSRGYVTVYHRTTKNAADNILKSKSMTAKEDGIFVSTKVDGEISGYGDTVVKLKIPVEKMVLDDMFDNELHFRIPLQSKNSVLNVSEYLDDTKHSFSDEENPISRFRTNTIERAEIFTPEDLEAISPTEFEYIPESDKQWDEQAVKNVQTDMRGVMEKIRNSDAMTSGTMSHEAAIISKILTDRYHQTGSISSFAELDDWLKTVAERTRETARALKATDTAWKKSPAAAVAKAQKVVRDSQEKMEDPKSKKARERREEANGIDKGLSGIEKTGLDKIAEGNEFGEAIKEYYENGERDISLYEFLLQHGVQNEDMEQFAKNIADMYDDFVKNKKKDYLKGVIKDDGRLKLTDQQTIDRLNERIANIFNNNKDRQAEYENRVLKRINPLLAREIKARGIDLTEIVKRGATATEEANRDFVKQLFADLNGRITEQDLKDLQEAAYREFARLAEVRRDNLINKYFHIDGDGNIITRSVVPKTRFSKIIELINLGAYGRSGVIEEMLKADDGLPTLSQNDINSILNLMRQAEMLDENDREYKIKIAKVKKIIESKLPTSKAAAVRAYARINMLLNPKTILTRNAGSNLIQSGVYNVGNVIGAGIDKALSKETNFRTAAMPDLRKQGEGAIKGISEAIEDYRNNVDTRGFDGKYDIGEGQPFQGDNAISKAFDKLNRFTGFLLDAGDRPFYEAYFADVLNQQMKANGVTKPTEDMIAVADMVALERTWQDSNVYTELFNGAKKLLNGVPLLNGKMIPPQIRQILDDKGIKVSQNGETTYYGLGDIIMPFVKTPANLLRSTIQYSPPGLAKAIIYDLGEFKSAVKAGTVTPQQQRQLVDNLSKGIVGTLVMLGGMALAGAGLYTGEDEEDARASAFKQYVEGIMPNSLKLGGTSVSLSWLQPLGGTLSFGATLADELEKDNSMTEKLWNSFANSLENLVNASVIQGLREFFSGDFNKAMDSFAEAAKDAGTQMLPLGSLTKQTANAFDNTTRSTYATDEKGKYLNRIKQYYPGASNTLEPRLNALGEEAQKSYDSTPDKISLADGARRMLTSFFNPANTRHINSTPLIDELNRLYDATGDSGVYPAEVAKNVTVDGKEYQLTPAQYTEYQRKAGKAVKEAFNAMIVDDEIVSGYAGNKSSDVQVTYADMTADERRKKETSIKSSITKSYKKNIGKEGVDVKDLSAEEKQELKQLQDEAVKRFKNGEPQTVSVVWSDVAYSQLDDAQKAEVLSSTLKKVKDAVNKELAEDWKKNARPVFKMGG